jgi:glycerophosphoryl diester phosphodiesterase
MAQPPLLSAHRGGPEGQFPPDTLETIAAACDLGVDFVEFDVWITGAGEFMIGHDAPSAVTLRSVLDTIRGRAQGHVDLKQVGAEVAIADLCSEILGGGNFIITSRHDESVRRLRSARPDLLVGLSLGRDPYAVGPVGIWLLRWSELFPWRRLRRCGANLIAAHHGLARLRILTGARRRGLPVLVWTLNTEALIRAARRDDRVWAFTTDFPRLALRLAAGEQ